MGGCAANACGQRNPGALERIFADLTSEETTAHCLRKLKEARKVLVSEGFHNIPSWAELLDGVRPSDNNWHCVREPGEWQHGWQFHASSHCETFFRRTVVLPACSLSARAHIRAHSGPTAGCAIGTAPTSADITLELFLFRTLLLERLGLPLSTVEAVCEGCGTTLEKYGIHRASCPVSGRLKARAAPMERVLARICREAGATVRFNGFLRDMNVGVSSTDGRKMEVLAQGLPCFGGSQLAVDATMRSSHGGRRSMPTGKMGRRSGSHGGTPG